ncbi:hypothetical protein POM88_015015 [Heracleum sosnowskyi]|uniref:DUF6821 domain-containing protein n=1 Tax=Heracleum sosnowskyi TaxID=360622 RepID=A0AAD8MVY8_9APIA|nr:hypothetical protein POM88_015015 [Heracleum sosnowskyi]
MDLDFVELDDWELLHSEETKMFDVVNNDSGVLIRPDYFDSRKVVIQESSGVCSDDGLVDEFEGDFVEKSGIDVGVVENEKSEVGLREKSDLDVGVVETEKFEMGLSEKSDIDVGVVENEKSEVGLREKSDIDVGGVENEKSEVGLREKSDIDVGVVETEKFEVGLSEKSELDVGFDGAGELVVRDLGGVESDEIEVGFVEKSDLDVGFDGVQEIGGRDLGVVENEEIEMGLVGGVDQSEDLGVGNTEMSDGADSNLRDEMVSGGGGEGDKHCDDVDIVGGERDSGEGEKRIMVWWKLPFEFLKYCVLRTSPVWTVSMAAAVLGFVILGRRYYSMKRKSRSVQVKVTMDDKKISQFKSRVVRLNEAFSVVKHVPIIRQSLPAAGVTPWPAMTLR